jgi:SAM-dependent methyltransferase
MLTLAATRGPVDRADAHRLPLADASMDAAITVATLEFTASPAQVLAEMARITRPGGQSWASPISYAERRLSGPRAMVSRSPSAPARRSSTGIVGAVPPASKRATPGWVMPARSASCRWDKLRWRRKPLRRGRVAA